MRVDINDAEQRRLAIGQGVRVFLDGIELSCVIMADEEKRTVERYRTDERGKVMLNKDLTEALTETMHGTVRIEAPAQVVQAVRQLEQARRDRR
jgi:hypothetical protein